MLVPFCLFDVFDVLWNPRISMAEVVFFRTILPIKFSEPHFEFCTGIFAQASHKVRTKARAKRAQAPASRASVTTEHTCGCVPVSFCPLASLRVLASVAVLKNRSKTARKLAQGQLECFRRSVARSRKHGASPRASNSFQ